MPIQHAVGQRTIIRCDYNRGGFQEPEMVKARPAIVVSPRLPHRNGLCTVVPISTTEPQYNVAYVVKIEMAQLALPAPYDSPIGWVKCDMIATVSFKRLDLLRTGRDQYGKRKYLHPMVPEADFSRICEGIRRALGMA